MGFPPCLSLSPVSSQLEMNFFAHFSCTQPCNFELSRSHLYYSLRTSKLFLLNNPELLLMMLPSFVSLGNITSKILLFNAQSTI